MELKDRRDEARRASAIYDEKILPTLDEESDKGRFVLIDLDSGDYEVGGRDMEGLESLLKRRPDASLWMERVGYDTALIYDPNDYHLRLFGAPVKVASQSD